jgi:hypothetical protein
LLFAGKTRENWQAMPLATKKEEKCKKQAAQGHRGLSGFCAKFLILPQTLSPVPDHSPYFARGFPKQRIKIMLGESLIKLNLV